MLYQVVPLDDTHNLEPFACGNDDLDQYLKNDAREEAELKLSAIFVMVPKDSPRVVGYFSLSSLHINAGDLPKELRSRLGRYRSVPATLIGRLAVDGAIQRQGYGRALLFKAMQRSLAATANVASAMVVVDAKDDAVAFYERNGFILLKKPRRLYFPMESVAAAIQ